MEQQGWADTPAGGCSAGELAAETCLGGCALCRVSVLVTKGALGLHPGAEKVAARELSLFI